MRVQLFFSVFIFFTTSLICSFVRIDPCLLADFIAPHTTFATQLDKKEYGAQLRDEFNSDAKSVVKKVFELEDLSIFSKEESVLDFGVFIRTVFSQCTTAQHWENLNPKTLYAEWKASSAPNDKNAYQKACEHFDTSLLPRLSPSYLLAKFPEVLVGILIAKSDLFKQEGVGLITFIKQHKKKDPTRDLRILYINFKCQQTQDASPKQIFTEDQKKRIQQQSSHYFDTILLPAIQKIDTTLYQAIIQKIQFSSVPQLERTKK